MVADFVVRLVFAIAAALDIIASGDAFDLSIRVHSAGVSACWAEASKTSDRVP